MGRADPAAIRRFLQTERAACKLLARLPPHGAQRGVRRLALMRELHWSKRQLDRTLRRCREVGLEIETRQGELRWHLPPCPGDWRMIVQEADDAATEGQ